MFAIVTALAYALFETSAYDRALDLEARCIYSTAHTLSTSGHSTDDLTDFTAQQTPKPIRYLQPIISQQQLVYAQTQACVVGELCFWSLQIGAELSTKAPLLRLTLPTRQVVYTTSAEICIINQVSTKEVYLQIVQRVEVIPGVKNECTIFFYSFTSYSVSNIFNCRAIFNNPTKYYCSD